MHCQLRTVAFRDSWRPHYRKAGRFPRSRRDRRPLGRATDSSKNMPAGSVVRSMEFTTDSSAAANARR